LKSSDSGLSAWRLLQGHCVTGTFTLSMPADLANPAPPRPIARRRRIIRPKTARSPKAAPGKCGPESPAGSMVMAETQLPEFV